MTDIPTLNSLESALLARAEIMGKVSEMQAFIARMKRDTPPSKHAWPVEYERALVFAYTDGIAYGNWPWSKV